MAQFILIALIKEGLRLEQRRHYKMTEKQISRKDFLKGMGTSIAGVAVVGSLGGLLTGCSQGVSSTGIDGIPEYPFKYVKLDPAKAEEIGYNTYFEKGG